MRRCSEIDGLGGLQSVVQSVCLSISEPSCRKTYTYRTQWWRTVLQDLQDAMAPVMLRVTGVTCLMVVLDGTDAVSESVPKRESSGPNCLQREVCKKEVSLSELIE